MNKIINDIFIKYSDDKFVLITMIKIKTLTIYKLINYIIYNFIITLKVLMGSPKKSCSMDKSNNRAPQ